MRLISLLSGGLDSPVASYQMIKEGCDVVLVHFFPGTASAASSQDKVLAIGRILAHYATRPIRLYLVPFGEAQRKIIMTVPSKFRMIVYRRTMLRIAERICEKEAADGFITGDSLGQVASQTVENLNCVYSVTNKIILTPLIGTDKQDIMRIAREIGTYDTSNLPAEDCCSYLVDNHPATRAKKEHIEDLEKYIIFSALIDSACASARVQECAAVIP